MRRFLRWSLGGGVLVFAAAQVVSLVAIPEIVLFPGRAKPSPPRAIAKGVTLALLEIRPEDGVTLKGFVMSPRENPASLPTLILLHGISSNKESFLAFAESLCAQGFRVAAFDSRAHGESQGGCCTYGWHEKKDISLIIEAVKTMDPSSRVGIFGNSLGGAIALQAMANDPRIECGVIESTFADFLEAACLRATAWTKIRIDPFVYPGLWRAGAEGDWKPFQVSPETAALSISKPVFMIHGSDDWVFPASHGERIFKNLSSPSKEWLLVPGGGHHGLSKSYGPGYEKRIIEFYKKWLMSDPHGSNRPIL